MTITIVLKEKDKDGVHNDIQITGLTHGKKIYHKIVKRWNRNKVVSLPTQCVSVASDEIHSIILSNK